jgi:hypothetical protein
MRFLFYLNGPKTLRLLLVWVMVMPVFAMQQPPNVRMHLMGESGAGLYEPLYATFSVQNNTGEVIQFDLGLNWKDAFEFSITSPDGTVHETGRLQSDGFGARGLVSISPGQTYSQRLLLNEWYDFPTPGTYGVRLTTNLVFQTAKGSSVPATAPDAITVSVSDKNDQRLRDLCAELTIKALSEDPPQDAQSDSAIALSHIRNPIVLPFLQQILESGSSVASEAAKGLSRLGSSGGTEAIDVLNASLGHADEELTSYIVSALLKALNTTTDETIKSQINRHLQP